MDQMDLPTLNLLSNMLWHSDSTFLPVPALTNILVGRVVTSSGRATELALTRTSWRKMPEKLAAKFRDRAVWRYFAISRVKVSATLAKLPLFHNWPAQNWKLGLTNPLNRTESLYIASHAHAVEGYSEEESQSLLDELPAFCTQDQFIYKHLWQKGDVLIWDQRAVMHRETPLSWHVSRKPTSICVSLGAKDGLHDMRPRE